MAVAIPLVGAPGASADVYTVNKNRDKVDPNPGNGNCEVRAQNNGNRCSLRAAVQSAEANPGSDKIRIKTDRVNLSIGSAGDADAASGDLDITDDTIVKGTRGLDGDVQIDARNLDRAFDVSASGALDVKRLLIRRGTPASTESGGAIRSEGSLLVLESEITDSAVSGEGASGGAVFSSGTFESRESAFTNNGAERAGGAVELAAPVVPTARGEVAPVNEISDSLFSGNSAGAAPGNGGALHITGNVNLAVADSEVRNNQAALEGGGFWNSSGTMTVRDTLFADNTATGAAVDDGGGALFNNGGDLDLEDGVVIESNDATGTLGSGGGILNNGGDLQVSNATITGNSAQRAGGGIESNGTGELSVINTMLDSNDAGANPGNGGALHITGMGDADITGGKVTNNVAGREGGGLWNDQGVMTVDGTEVADNTANGGVAADDGGGGLFNNGGDLVVEKGTLITSNTAAGTTMGSGGGILNVGGDLDVTAALISGNSAQRAGGGIETSGGTVDLVETDLIENETGPSPGNGGGLHVTGTATTNVTDSLVKDNVATSEGGGLWNNLGTMTVEGTVVRGNSAAGADATNGGGGLFQNPGGTLVVQDGSSVVSNEATGTAGSGGGVLNDQGTLTVADATVAKNTAVRAGGGIEANLGSSTLDGVSLTKNSTGANPGNGGGFHLTGEGDVKIDNSAVTQNSAQNEGGGLWNSATGTMDVDTTAICNNTAPTGANVFNDGGTFTVNDQPAVDGTPCAENAGGAEAPPVLAR